MILRAGTKVSVCRADDPDRAWKAHTIQRDVEVTDKKTGSSGAAVLECEGWLILTRWKEVER